MIIFKKQNTSKPIKKYKTFYDQALKKNQKNIEAISVSSYNLSNQEISSRFDRVEAHMIKIEEEVDKGFEKIQKIVLWSAGTMFFTLISLFITTMIK